LKAKKNVPNEKLLVRALLALTFVISNVAPNIKAKVEKIWSLCYRKAKMPYLQLIAKNLHLALLQRNLKNVSLGWHLLKK
jgi:hypothetical protein